MIFVILINSIDDKNYMVVKGTSTTNFTEYGARDRTGLNYRTKTIEELATVTVFEPVRYQQAIGHMTKAVYGPFPSLESLTHYQDYPELFI